jgi:hypothetical protein
VVQEHPQSNTKRAYQNAIKDFMLFTGIKRPEEFRLVTPAHVIAWRDGLGERVLNGTTIRHRMAALSSLFQYLCDKNAVTHNPVKGVKRPRSETDEGKRLHSPTTRRANCSSPRPRNLSKAFEIGPSSPPCSTMRSAVRNSANSPSGISCTNAAASGICGFPGKVRRHGTCRFTESRAI